MAEHPLALACRSLGVDPQVIADLHDTLSRSGCLPHEVVAAERLFIGLLRAMRDGTERTVASVGRSMRMDRSLTVMGFDSLEAVGFVTAGDSDPEMSGRDILRAELRLTPTARAAIRPALGADEVDAVRLALAADPLGRRRDPEGAVSLLMSCFRAQLEGGSQSRQSLRHQHDGADADLDSLLSLGVLTEECDGALVVHRQAISGLKAGSI